MTRTILINKDNKIKDNYLNKINLVQTKDIYNNDIKVEEETYNAYLQLQDFLQKENINIAITSAYRTLEEQQATLEEFIEKYGEEYAYKAVAPVGTSEHHTGLAIDISVILNGEKPTDKADEEEKILKEKTYQEIHKHLHKFGFILRYPKGKEEITKYPYEPWHIRYVGKFVAKIIYENNYTLEEYLTKYGKVVLINKEKDMTSFDVVNKVSKLFGIKRVGHTGTLDPLATGVLIIAVGQATKVVELLTATYKEYIAEVKLGIKTDTLDITGNIIGEKEIPENINIEKTLNSFKKTYLQEVPIYSAVKVNGKKLYDYARNNEEVELPKKEVTIKEIELLEQNNNTFKFKTLVSKGCYIRSLINDIGNELNTYATMTNLERTKQGIISIEETSSLTDLDNEQIKLYDIDELLDYPVVEVDEFLEKLIRTGRPLINTFKATDKIIFKDKNLNILGIYQVENEELRCWKNFV